MIDSESVAGTTDTQAPRRAPLHLAETLQSWQPPLRRREFWAVQLLVLVIAVGHVAIELTEGPDSHNTLSFIPTSLFLIPAVYAALNFGLRGSLPTALWSAVLSVPNVLVFHTGTDRIAPVWQLSIVVLVAIFVGYRIDREQRARHQAEEREEARRQSEYERGRELEAYAKRTTEAREAERARIARELHDGPVQSLILLWRRLDALGELADPGQQDELDAARRAVHDAADELRRVSRDLRPSILDHLGLTAALNAELSAFGKRSGISADLTTSGRQRRLGSATELALLRITQEALRNVGQHSGARRVNVRLRFEPARVRMAISDDGAGIAQRPASDLVAAGKLGLIGMREQARLVNASFKIVPDENGGTTITVVAPG